MKRLICLILGHKMSVKLQVTRGYTMFICDRCGNVFTRKIEKKPKLESTEEELA